MIKALGRELEGGLGGGGGGGRERKKEGKIFKGRERK